MGVDGFLSEEGERKVFFRWEARFAEVVVVVEVGWGERGACRGVWAGRRVRMEERWVGVMMRASVRYSSSC